MELGRIFATLKSFRWWIASSALLCAAAAVVWHFTAAPKYAAKAFVYLDISGLSQPSGGGGGGLQASTFSQIEIATSERVLVEAAAHLDPAVRAKMFGSSEPNPDPDRLIGTIRRALNVTVGRDSTVIQIGATDRDPAVASDIANAVANGYLQVTLALKTEPARQKAAFYQARVAELQTAAVESQEQVAAFRQQTGLVATSAERGDVEQALLGELIRRTTELRAQYLGSAAGRSVVPANPAATSEVRGSGVVQSLQIDIARARTRFQELETRLGKNHPQYKAAADELAELERSLDREVALTASSVSTAGIADTRSAEKLNQVVEKQKAVIVDLTAKREQLALLQQRADYARKSLEMMRDKLSDALIETRSNIGGTTLLAAAQPPKESSNQPLQRTVPLAAFLGLVFASFGAVVVEQRKPRLRAQSDLTRLGLRTIALIPTAVASSVRDIQTLAAPTPAATADRRLGSLLIAAGRLSKSDGQSVYEEHMRRNQPFGLVAVEMGLLSESDVQEALSTQYGMRRVTNAAIGEHTPEQFVVDQHPSHPVAEAVRVLRSYLILEAERTGRGNMLAVTSPDRGDGKSFISANLAIAFSQAGMRTLLIEADMRDPQLAVRFGSSRREGLSSFLAGLVPNAPILPLDATGQLSLLPAGPRPPNPQELLCNPRFAELMRSLPAQFDMVIVDTPANSVGSDAQIIAARAGSAVVVGRWNETGTDSVKLLLKRLADADVVTVGSIINHFDGDAA